jgi:hypothetical protein
VPDIQQLILDQLRTLDGKLDDCRAEIGSTREAVTALEAKVDERARWTDLVREAVDRRLISVEKEQVNQGKLTAGMKAKIGLVGTALGALAGWLADRIYPT